LFFSENMPLLIISYVSLFFPRCLNNGLFKWTIFPRKEELIKFLLVVFIFNISNFPRLLGKPTSSEKIVRRILKEYTLIADFQTHPPTRPISQKLFWRYPFSVPETSFQLYIDQKNLAEKIPIIPGVGRVIEHLNLGRSFFIKKDYLSARKIWLAARARYGKDYSLHRRTDYLIALSFLYHGWELSRTKNLPLDKEQIMFSLDNATTFFNWSLVLKSDIPDPWVDQMAPEGFYNMSAIYFRYKRYGGSFDAAERGLNFLRKTGRKDHKVSFLRILGEAYLKNHDYLLAMQMFDQALRVNRDVSTAAKIFARVADIYFNLNNYELAEDIYRYMDKFGEYLNRFSPIQLIFKGEALFWLGKFDQAQKSLKFALDYSRRQTNYGNVSLNDLAYARLRFADSYLAKNDLKQARLNYFRVEHLYPKTRVANIAAIRRVCLEFPRYKGKNKQHARNFLEQQKRNIHLESEALELAWRCLTISYTNIDDKKMMLKKIREFAQHYPKSKTLIQFYKLLRNYKINLLRQYIAENSQSKAIAYFETYQEQLFPNHIIPEDLSLNLFRLYIDAQLPERADVFYPASKDQLSTHLDQIRLATFFRESHLLEKTSLYLEEEQKLIDHLLHFSWNLQPNQKIYAYMNRLNIDQNDQYGLWILRFYIYLDQQKHLCHPISGMLLKLPWKKRDKTYQKSVLAYWEKHSEKTLTQLVINNKTCLKIFLEAERTAYSYDFEKIFTIYEKRKNLFNNPTFIKYLWLLAEDLWEHKKLIYARKIWQTIIDHATKKNHLEKQFASSRLEHYRTEYNDLWQSQ